MKKQSKRSFDSLSAAEKEAVYRRMERVGAGAGEKLTARDRTRHRRAGLRVGRPTIGRGAKRINISMERSLLESADSFARDREITRAHLIAQSVRAYLKRAA